MQFQILKDPMSILEVHMSKDESIIAEAGALVYLKGDIEIKTKMRANVLKTVKVSFLGSESFFVNEYIAKEDGCSLGLTGPPVGDIVEIPITPNDGYIVQSGSYIASTPGVEIDTKWQGFTKGIFGSEFFMLKVTGAGKVFCNVYGGVIQKQLAQGEQLTLDNYHLVALTLNSEYKVTKFGGLKSTILGGEGLVTQIMGPATIYFQTKNLKELIDLLGVRNTQSETQGNNFSVGGFKFGF
ncbi:MAG: TIGR00266 family protein [Nitrososphaeria archaeon]|nr:TIGR00266 family protein [Nitrososphaeria archaeon]NDB51263.1 TIGR00266 family protein [Nitrosopumilaceae archaeon]NDB88111.1 TIGR00266 family protein [Nitrososphaerota archaeon]NDB89805.1 TIGR00266 family protein [Nitrososphaerota archaeon]NDF26214.1 TIGR00266 family protein [Nitrosopumilaceae archaeon]